MLARLTLTMVMLALVSLADSVMAKPPRNPNGAEFYFFIIHGTHDDVWKFWVAYDNAYKPQSALEKLCLDPSDIFWGVEPPARSQKAVGFLCDKKTDSIAEIVKILSTMTTPTMQLSSTGTCTGLHCSKDGNASCTKYSCSSGSDCYHDQYWCSGLHKCIQ